MVPSRTGMSRKWWASLCSLDMRRVLVVVTCVVLGMLTRGLLQRAQATPDFPVLLAGTRLGPTDSVIAWDEHFPGRVKRHELPVTVADATLNSTRHALRDFGGYVGPRLMDYIMLEQATDTWRHTKSLSRNRTWFMPIPVSIIVPPNPEALAQHNTGYIMAAVMSCCSSWNITRILLQSLLDMDDPVHVVLIDDNSVDGTQENAAALGIPVLTTGRTTGVTASMNRAWQYFTSYDSLQSLVLLNNDVLFSPGSFNKLHRCVMSMPANSSGVVGPLSNAYGLGHEAGLKIGFSQAIGRTGVVRQYFNGVRPPAKFTQRWTGNVTERLEEVTAWLETATAHTASTNRMHNVGFSVFYGFVLGFRKDNSIADYTDNILLQGDLNCLQVFAYHMKSATFLEADRSNFTGDGSGF